MKTAIKRALIGSPVEHLARKAWHKTQAAIPGAVDAGTARARRYDDLTGQIARKVLPPTGTVIDVGANQGKLLAQFVRAAPRGTWHAVEPLPNLAEGLRRSFPAVTVHETAVADYQGEAQFRHVMSAEECSGFVRREHDEYDETVRLIDVRVSRLDDLFPDLSPDLLKIDVEGAEAEALKGAGELLTRTRCVVIEVGGTGPEVYRLLTDAGLGVNRLDWWLDGRAALSFDEFMHEATVPKEFMFVASR